MTWVTVKQRAARVAPRVARALVPAGVALITSLAVQLLGVSEQCAAEIGHLLKSVL